MKPHPRFSLPGVAQHVVIRGSGQQPCFYSDDDYLFFLTGLRKSATVFKCNLHAYVIMPDHVHLVVTPGAEFAVSNMIQSLTRRHARYMKELHQVNEPVWQSHYKASIIESRNYLFACMCYVEVNPVRSNIVNVPSEYCWSSYHANAYNKDAVIVDHHHMYTDLGPDNASRSEAYRKIFTSRVEVGSVHSIRNALHQELILGSFEFRNRIEATLESFEKLSKAKKIVAKDKVA